MKYRQRNSGIVWTETKQDFRKFRISEKNIKSISDILNDAFIHSLIHS